MNRRERPWLTVVELRVNDGWRGIAVIDGRNYPDPDDYESAVTEAFEQCGHLMLPATFASREAGDGLVGLPSWAEYFAKYTEERARTLLAEYHNEDLPAEVPRVTADDFGVYQVTAYEEWLIFNAESGFSNQTFLVSDPMVYESPGWQSSEDALTEARALKAAGATRRPPG
jgi:hypothetical protein